MHFPKQTDFKNNSTGKVTFNGENVSVSIETINTAPSTGSYILEICTYRYF